MENQNSNEQKPQGGDPAQQNQGQNPEDQGQGQNQGSQNQGGDQGQGSPGQGEIENLKKAVEDMKSNTEKQMNQFGFTIRKLQDKAKEQGFNLEEGEEPLSEEKVRSIVSESTKPVSDQLNQLGTSLSEMMQAQKANQQASPGSGGGQRPPQKKTKPALSQQNQQVLNMAGISWSNKEESFVDQQGNKVDIENVPGVVQE